MHGKTQEYRLLDVAHMLRSETAFDIVLCKLRNFWRDRFLTVRGGYGQCEHGPELMIQEVLDCSNELQPLLLGMIAEHIPSLRTDLKKLFKKRPANINLDGVNQHITLLKQADLRWTHAMSALNAPNDRYHEILTE